MAIPHVQAGEIANVMPLGADLVGTRTHALFKSEDLEVMRIVMLAGDTMPSHAVAGEITLQCVEGRVVLTYAAGECELIAGQLIHLARNDPHALRCIDNASLLLTIVLRPDPHNGRKT
ncbi:MAG: cupin [Variovorax sp.]